MPRGISKRQLANARSIFNKGDRSTCTCTCTLCTLRITWSVLCTGTNLGLGTKDLKIVYRALFEVRAKWRRIGLELDLTPGTLDAIEQRKNIDPSDRLEAVLVDWLRGATAATTWKQLIDAVRSAPVDEMQLARKLELEHCSPGKKHKPIPPPIETGDLTLHQSACYLLVTTQ